MAVGQDKRRIMLTLDKKDFELISLIAAREDRSCSYVVRRIVREALAGKARK